MTRVNYRELVTEALRSMNLVDDAGRVKHMDSLTLIDLVVLLEEKSERTIPTPSLRADNFESVDTIVEMLEDLDEA